MKANTKNLYQKDMGYRHSINSVNSATMELVETSHITGAEFFRSSISQPIEKIHNDHTKMSFRLIKFKMFRFGFRVLGKVFGEN